MHELELRRDRKTNENIPGSGNTVHGPYLRVLWMRDLEAVDEGNGETFLRNHDFGPAFKPREDSLGKDEAGVTSVACVEVAAVDACVIEGVEERGEVKVTG